MNRILNAKPPFGGDHFVYRTPGWLEAASRIGFLSIAGLTAYIAISVRSIPLLLTVLLCLATGMLLFLAVRRRAESASVHFVCDQEGIYFPSPRAKAIFARRTETRWLHVPWHNVANIKTQLLLDETGNTKGLVLYLLATEPEHRQFLAEHEVRHNLGVRQSETANVFAVGFANFLNQHDEILSRVRRFRSTSQTGPDLSP